MEKIIVYNTVGNSEYQGDIAGYLQYLKDFNYFTERDMADKYVMSTDIYKMSADNKPFVVGWAEKVHTYVCRGCRYKGPCVVVDSPEPPVACPMNWRNTHLEWVRIEDIIEED